MLRNLKLRSFIFLLITASAAFTTAYGQEKNALTPEIRQKTFERVWQIVDEKYWDPTFGGTDWKAVRNSYGPQVNAAASDKEFYALMAKMLGTLKTSHMDLLTPEILAKYRQAPAIVGVGYREIDGLVVITHVLERSSAEQAGIKPGFAILKVDGVPIKTFAEAQEKLVGMANTSLKLTYLDDRDETRDVVLERRPLGEDSKSKLAGVSFYGLFESRRLEGNIGYFFFSNFLEFLNPKIRSTIESMNDAPGIIIDLRGNSGGDDSVGLKMASMFFEKETVLMITRTRKGDISDYKASGMKTAFRGRVVILVDNLSRSASEEFSAGMQASGRAVVVGRKTAGGDMDGELEKLPDGSILLYAHGQPRTPKGYIVEGNGVRPDIEIGLTRKGLLAGHDAQLEAAIEYIKRTGK